MRLLSTLEEGFQSAAKDLLAYMGTPPDPPRSFQRRRRSGRRLPDAWAGLEVDSVGKMYLEDWEQIDKTPSKCVQTRGPETRGQSQSPKRVQGPDAWAVLHFVQPAVVAATGRPRGGATGGTALTARCHLTTGGMLVMPGPAAVRCTSEAPPALGAARQHHRGPGQSEGALKHHCCRDGGHFLSRGTG
jgi:hypothetical protein